MGFWIKVCAIFSVSALGGLVFGTADEVFNLGIWRGHYPPVYTEDNGSVHYETYGAFMLWAAIIFLVASGLGSWLWWRRLRRAEDALLLMEYMRQRGYEEGAEAEPEAAVSTFDYEIEAVDEGEGSPSLAELERKYLRDDEDSQ